MSGHQRPTVFTEGEPQHLIYQENNDDEVNLQSVVENSTKYVTEAKIDVDTDLAPEKPVSSNVLPKEMTPVKIQAEINFDDLDVKYDSNGVPIIPYEKLFNIRKGDEI